MIEGIGSVVGTIALGGAGWLLTQFFVIQLKHFYDVRQKVHEELVYSANVGGGGEGADKEWMDRLQKAQRDIRRLAAKLHAIESSASRLTSTYLRLLGYYPRKAGAALIGYSNTLTDKDGSRALHRNEAEKALRLPVEYDDAMIKAIREGQGRRDIRAT